MPGSPALASAPAQLLREQAAYWLPQNSVLKCARQQEPFLAQISTPLADSPLLLGLPSHGRRRNWLGIGHRIVPNSVESKPSVQL